VSDLHSIVKSADEPTVVLLHEGAGSSALWLRYADATSAGRRTLIYDRRGYGESPRDVILGPAHFDQGR
jgi:pimeloyl-ACP methyl ester carboxylesterase